MAEVILVTGGTRGIGAAISRLAARKNYAVAMTYASDTASATAMEEELTGQGAPCFAALNRADTPEAVAALIDQVEEALGPVTALVNNAGITGRISDFTDVAFATMQDVVSVNLLSPMILTQALVRKWITQGIKGRVVNLSSVAARLGAPREYIPYAAAKAGVEAFTTGLAKEVAPHGIRVNAVAPGTTATDIHAAAGEPSRPERIARTNPMGRVAEPEEIANAVLWLLSEEASYITGQTLTVSGGV